MATLEFTLFRVQVFPSSQTKLWPGDIGPRDVLKMKLAALPTIESSNGATRPPGRKTEFGLETNH